MRLIGVSSSQWSEATSAIEARRLHAAKEKSEALPSSFSERKLKMVRVAGLEPARALQPNGF